MVGTPLHKQRKVQPMTRGDDKLTAPQLRDAADSLMDSISAFNFALEQAEMLVRHRNLLRDTIAQLAKLQADPVVRAQLARVLDETRPKEECAT